jgi:hypothetical protein
MVVVGEATPSFLEWASAEDIEEAQIREITATNERADGEGEN